MACDGGKDSLSMAASAGGETVKAPGNLVVSAYVTCPDITATVTPDLKLSGTGRLLHVDLAAGRRRLGGSNLAQAFSQVCSRALAPCRITQLANAAVCSCSDSGRLNMHVGPCTSRTAAHTKHAVSCLIGTLVCSAALRWMRGSWYADW